MQCLNDTCSAPAKVIARIKHGPGKWSLLTRVCACDQHVGEISDAVPEGKTIQVIPIPCRTDRDGHLHGARTMPTEAVESVLALRREHEDYRAGTIATELKLPRVDVVAVLRMAGLQP